MISNLRSTRQVESLYRIRDWHWNSALRAHLEGRDDESRFHLQHYRLLGPALGDEAPVPAICARTDA